MFRISTRPTAPRTRRTFRLDLWLPALLASALALTITPAAQASTQARTTDQVRVLSYNIHHGAGLDGVLDLQCIADEIEATGAEIVGLQEVDNHWGTRSDWQDQATVLADLLDMHVVYGANLDLAPGEGQTEPRQYGTAILSKYPILSSQNHLLTSLDYPDRPTEQRGLLHAEINVRGAHVDFYNTHLDHQRAEQRTSQVNEILDIVDDSAGTAILVGDLNATPDAAEVRLLTDDVFTDAFAGSDGDFTYPAEAPTKRIDFILAHDARSFTDAAVLATEASDHLPLAATITFDRPQD